LYNKDIRERTIRDKEKCHQERRCQTPNWSPRHERN